MTHFSLNGCIPVHVLLQKRLLFKPAETELFSFASMLLDWIFQVERVADSLLNLTTALEDAKIIASSVTWLES